MGSSQPTTYRKNNTGQKMEMDWPHAEEGWQQHNETSFKMGTTGKEEQGQAKEHLAPIGGRRDEGSRI